MILNLNNGIALEVDRKLYFITSGHSEVRTLKIFVSVQVIQPKKFIPAPCVDLEFHVALKSRRHEYFYIIDIKELILLECLS